MPRSGFVGPAYQLDSVNADCQTCINWYCETVESGQGKGPLVFRETPGLKLLYQLGSAGIRGITPPLQGRTFAVAGTQLWELYPFASSPNCKNWSLALNVNLLSDGTPVSMAGGPTQLLIASGGATYVFNLTNNTLTDITATVGGTVSQVGYADGFFFALFANSGKIQASNPLDASVWPGASATVVSVFPDNVLALTFDHRRMWALGTGQTQTYFDSGNFPFPYDIEQGGFIETGIAAPNSVVQLDNSIFWIAQDKRGSGVIVRANGYTPTRVSNHAIEHELSTYSTIADAVCYGYQDQGHSFYVANFPTAQKTWVSDCATQMWHRRAFLDPQSGSLKQSRAQYHSFSFGMHLAGDPTTGSIYQMSTFVYSDFGNPIYRERTAPHISNEQARIGHNELQVDVETGLGPQPPLQGQATPTVITLADATGGLWDISVSDLGVINSVISGRTTADAISLILNDPAGNPWGIVPVTGTGILQPIAAAAGTYPSGMFFYSSTGKTRWNLLLHLEGANVVLDTFPLGMVGRGPTMFMKFSDDGGRTWSNEYSRDCGQAGKFLTRVRWMRLGTSRDRVYRIYVTDPVPWRIIDAYLYTDQDQGPTSRYASEMRKRA
ncbi:MAG: hypothetical protein JWQ87_2250 [Candidatus Sulfotelmatobacter sp.]|nr:hypothetical protein [Candidatus Sulfotelmatobacter sp.]